jgi:hypothetical protein
MPGRSKTPPPAEPFPLRSNRSSPGYAAESSSDSPLSFDRSGSGRCVRESLSVATLYHVTSSANRDSIHRHGLDWGRMSSEPGIAGSPTPEQPGVFLAADRFEADFFVQMGHHRLASVDIWEVVLDDDGDDLRNADLRLNEFDGFLCWMEAIPPSRVRLVAQDL